MPTYKYECKACGFTFDAVYPIADRDAPLDENCEYCGEKEYIRTCGNAGGFRLIGGCWASDGYSVYLGDVAKHKRVG